MMDAECFLLKLRMMVLTAEPDGNPQMGLWRGVSCGSLGQALRGALKKAKTTQHTACAHVGSSTVSERSKGLTCGPGPPGRHKVTQMCLGEQKAPCV